MRLSTHTRCRQLQLFHGFLALLTQGLISGMINSASLVAFASAQYVLALLSVRTYALYRRKCWFLPSLLPAWFLAAAVGIVSAPHDARYISAIDVSISGQWSAR